jgi:hypothetical protein
VNEGDGSAPADIAYLFSELNESLRNWPTRGNSRVSKRSEAGTVIPTEAVEEIAELIEHVDAAENWDSDPSIYKKYARAILAAGYSKDPTDAA